MSINKVYVVLGLLVFCGIAQAMDLKEFYTSMRAKEVNLSFQDSQGHIMLGVSTFEKSEGNVICRRTGAVVPKPVYGYACYVAMRGIDSFTLNRGTQGEPITVVRNDGSQSQAVVHEKAGAGYICQTVQEPGEQKESVQCYAAIRD